MILLKRATNPSNNGYFQLNVTLTRHVACSTIKMFRTLKPYWLLNLVPLPFIPSEKYISNRLFSPVKELNISWHGGDDAKTCGTVISQTGIQHNMKAKTTINNDLLIRISWVVSVAKFSPWFSRDRADTALWSSYTVDSTCTFSHICSPR